MSTSISWNIPAGGRSRDWDGVSTAYKVRMRNVLNSLERMMVESK